jgi:hypothetical protein
MTTKDLHVTDQAARRTAIERIIASYPDISDDNLQDVLRYFKGEASALDRATIASNSHIARQYRQLCHDHYIDRLSPVETAIAVASATALIAGLVALSLLF